MTIAVIWQEDGVQFCAADTRLVAEPDDRTTTEIATKICVIPVITRAMASLADLREPHYWAQYGFVYAGAALPASMTAVTASTLLQTLARPGGLADPPTFEKVAEFVHRLANRFMTDRRQFGGGGIFSAAFFGWCPHAENYKIAYIDGRNDAGSFRVELSYPCRPQTDGEPWLVLGSAAAIFESQRAAYLRADRHLTKRVPRRVIEKMVAEGRDRTVGGAISIGIAQQHTFNLYYALEPVVPGQSAARRIFNGLDLDTGLGQVGDYIVAVKGLA